MQLSQLSDLVLKLTDSAVELGPTQHQKNLVDILRNVVKFDAAWWGWSDLSKGRNVLVNTSLYRMPENYHKTFATVAKDDPFIRYGRYLPVFSMSLDTKHGAISEKFRNFLQSYQIESILNGHCRLKGDTSFNLFMSLYRTDKKISSFTEEERTNFHTILQHLEQSLSLSLRMELKSIAPENGEAAIVSSDGSIVRMTRNFRQNLMHSDLSRYQIRKILQNISVKGGSWYQGKFLMFAKAYSKDLTLILQHPTKIGFHLSNEESKVAQLYISGMTMKQISISKGVSLNTIRNQVASIYKKTQTSNKIALSQKLRA